MYIIMWNNYVRKSHPLFESLVIEQSNQFNKLSKDRKFYEFFFTNKGNEESKLCNSILLFEVKF
jgi:hypothetical protein